MKSKKSKCDCPDSGMFPLAGPGFSRRNFLRIGGTALVATYFSDVVNPQLLYGQTVVNPRLQNTAKNCVMVFLSGAPSHSDLWDLKEGSWTPARLEPTSYGGIRWPRGLMPRTAEHLDKIALVRSGLSWAAVHGLGQQWAQIARNPGTPAGGIAPHIGAVVALESQLRRKPEDILPGFVGMFGLSARAGYLPARYAPFVLRPNQDGLTALRHPDGVERLRQRYDFLSVNDPLARNGEFGRNAADMGAFYDQAKFMMDSPSAAGIFTWGFQDEARYGNTTFAEGMIVARNLLRAKKGTRFVQVTYPGWDHHTNIYGANGSSLVTMCPALDRGLASLMDDLIATPGEEAGKTLLDETLIVILAEFGRTVGPITGGQGRDHYLRMSYVFAGGGVKGGAIGQTDSIGADVVDFGWSGNRDVRFEDVTATIYSALGIDYTTIRRDVPISRGFEYVPQARDGVYKPIDEIFAS